MEDNSVVRSCITCMMKYIDTHGLTKSGKTYSMTDRHVNHAPPSFITQYTLHIFIERRSYWESATVFSHVSKILEILEPTLRTPHQILAKFA